MLFHILYFAEKNWGGKLKMADLIIKNGIIVTMDSDRRIISNGAIVVEKDRIIDVGTTEQIKEKHKAEKIIDASNHVILPGFISAHVHVADIFLRGISANRRLYDWLDNIKYPGTHVMSVEEHILASALYCQEAIQSGITTFVENAAGSGKGEDDETIKSKLEVYDIAGMRNIYAQAIMDQETSQELKEIREIDRAKEPHVNHVSLKNEAEDTNEALDRVEFLIKKYHGTADKRQSIWPSPYLAWAVTPEALNRSYELAEKYNVMTTTHVSEMRIEEQGYHSSIEKLYSYGYLGKRTLLAHCVHLNEKDIRLLAITDTKVAHNIMANLSSGYGISPVPTMINYGVTVGIGTDNTSLSDTVNMINDMRFVALVHKGYHEDPGIMTAEKVLEMATIDGARAIGREDDLGSLEPGKKADIVLLNLNHPHLTPHTNIASCIVYQAQGFEVNTVICNGKIIMENREVKGIESKYPDLLEEANKAAENIIEKAGLTEIRNRPWTSITG